MEPASLAKFLNLSIVFSLTLMGLAMVPFFAPVAKHQFYFTEAHIGYIFGSFPIGYIATSLLTSLLDIAHFSSFKINLIIRLVTVVNITSCLLFGSFPFMLHFSPEPDVVLRNAVAFCGARFTQGCSAALLDVMLLLILVRLFPKSLSDVVGQWQSMSGLGILFGPPLGGLLYQAGGFFVPFIACGTLSGILVLGTSILLFRSEKLKALFAIRDRDYKKSRHHKSVTSKHVIRLLRAPFHLVLGPALLNGFGVSCFTLMESMAPLEFHDAYKVSSAEMGGFIGLASLLYACTAIFLGKKIGQPAMVRRRPLILVIGSLCLAGALFLSGPGFEVVNPHVHLSTMAGRTSSVSGLCVLGLFLGTVTVVGPAIILTAAKGKGDKLVPAAGSISNMANSIGAFVGPIAGSHLIHALSFKEALYYYGCASVVLGALYLSTYFYSVRRGNDVVHLSELQTGYYSEHDHHGLQGHGSDKDDDDDDGDLDEEGDAVSSQNIYENADGEQSPSLNAS